MNFGFNEILLICIVILLLFGGKKLPELARGIGNGIRELRSAMRDDHGNSNNPNSVNPSDPNARPINDQSKPTK